MPAPHSFWVILIGKTPTSFRAKEREDLVPTLRQLQRTQTDVTLRWFERGKVWESPEAAIGAAKLAETEAREKRTKEWRPGGEHRDPRARFELTRDQKRAKFKREQAGGDRPASPFGPRPPRDERPRSERPRDERPRDERPRDERPRENRSKPEGRPRSPWSDRPPSGRPKPGGGRPERPFSDRGPRPPRSDNRDRAEGRGRPPSEDRPFGDRPPRRDRPSGPPMENPFKDRRPARRPEGRSDRRPDSGRPGRPTGDRGGFKPPKRKG